MKYDAESPILRGSNYRLIQGDFGLDQPVCQVASQFIQLCGHISPIVFAARRVERSDILLTDSDSVSTANGGHTYRHTDIPVLIHRHYLA